MIKPCQQGLLRGQPILALALLAMWQSAYANPLQVGLRWDEKYSDNIYLKSDNPKSDLKDRAVLSLQHHSDPGPCGSDLMLDAGFNHYQQHSYSDQTDLNGSWNGSCQLSNSFRWTAQDHVSQEPINTAQPITPNNQTRRNLFSTGPQYLWKIDPTNELNSRAQYQKNNYSNLGQSNARHYVASTTYTHLLSTNLSAGVGANIDRGELDSGENILQKGTNFQFSKTFLTTQVSGSIGYSELTDTIGNFTSHNPGVVWSLELKRQLNKSSSWFFNYGRELTDTTSQSALLIRGLTYNLAQTSAIRLTHWRTGYNKGFVGGGTVQVSGGQQMSDYLQQGFTEKGSDASVQFTQPLITNLSASMSLSVNHQTFPTNELIENTYSGSIGLDYQRTERLRFEVRMGRNQLNANSDSYGYREDWLLVGAAYRFR